MPSTAPTTTAFVIDSRTLAERWAQHAIAVLKSGSTYVIAIGGALVTIMLDRWAVMSVGQQSGLIGSLGITEPGTLSTILTLVTLAARFKPAAKGTISPVLQEALERLSAVEMNARLVAQGQRPLALPAPKVRAITHAQIDAVSTPVAPSAATSVGAPEDFDDGFPETLPPPMSETTPPPMVPPPMPPRMTFAPPAVPVPVPAPVAAPVPPPVAAPAARATEVPDLRTQFALQHPEWTPEQLDAVVAAYPVAGRS